MTKNGIVMIKLFSLSLVILLLYGCASTSDPLGSVVTDPDTGSGGELEPERFVVVREIRGDFSAGATVFGGNVYGAGIRVIESLEPLQGCVTYKLGNADYQSPNCKDFVVD